MGSSHISALTLQVNTAILNSSHQLHNGAIMQYDSQEMPLIIDILQQYNPRIQEVLNLRKSDIYEKKFVILHGCKKSADVILRDKILVARIVKLSKERTDVIFIHSNYKRVFRFCEKNFSHLFSQIEINKNRKITHCFRYNAVDGISNDNSVKSILSHNSKKSNKFYTNKIRR